MSQSEDDELEAYWADVRGPRPPRPSPIETLNLPKWSWLPALDAFGRATVYIGLFTPNGEVSALDYRRLPTIIHVIGNHVQIDRIEFPTTQNDWGEIRYFGVCLEEEFSPPVLFLNTSNVVTVRSGDSLNLTQSTVYLG